MTRTTTPRSQQHYRSLLEQHPDGVYEFDLQGRFVDGNDALADRTGYQVADLVGETFLAIVHPDDTEQAIAGFRTTIAGETCTYDARILARDGGLCHVHVTTVPIVVDGAVVGGYGIARDVSEARAAQRALEESEARVRQMFDASGVGVALMTPDTQFVRTNPALQTMTGFDAAELAETDLWGLVHADDKPRVAEALRLLLETGRPSVAVQPRCRHREGHTVWLRLSLTALEWSGDLPPLVMATVEDVTSLRQTDERLELTQSLLRMAGEVARVGGWRLDAATGGMRWSPEVYDVLGVPLGRSPDREASLRAYPPEHRSRVSAAIDTCVAEGRPFDLEVEVEPSPHQRMWVRLIGEPEHDRDGRVVAVRGAVQNIDQHRLAERETRELAERLTATFESITDAVLTLDSSWRVTYLNSRAAQLVRRERTDLLGRVIWDEFPAARDSIVEETYRRVAATGVPETVEEFAYAPLETWFELNVYPLNGGVTVYFRDVTAERETRRRMRERDARMRQQAHLLDQARDAIIVRDMDGVVTYWNHSAERLYGWSAQEARDHPIQDLIYANNVGAHDEALTTTLETGTWAGEVTHVDRTGREVIVEARWTLVHDEETGNASVMAINTDVTERKQLEAQFLQAQRMESLGTLASGIAHDLNNALSPVLMAGQILGTDEDDPDRQELLEVITDSARRGAEMVQQVLSFARGIEGSRVPVDLAATVQGLQRLTRDTFPKSIAVHLNVAPDVWPVTGDPTQLHQVLLNLCVNARDAMPDGGTLTVSVANLVVEGRERPHRPDLEPGPYVRITVSDTGQGMSHEVLDHAFEPFYTTKAEGSGTGLGLSTSLGIVESHGGVLEAHSRPGLGSIFTIDLPATPDALAAETSTEGTSVRGDGQLVLLVDDEPAVRQLTSTVLERAGYRTVTATDGLDAIEKAREHGEALALVVTDLVMPHMNGATAIEHIRQDLPDVPVVAVSGLRAELERDARRLGTMHLLRKPFTTPELLDVVAAALQRTGAS